MPKQAQEAFPFGSGRPSVIVLPPTVREELRTLVARLLLQAIRQQQTREGSDEERK